MAGLAADSAAGPPKAAGGADGPHGNAPGRGGGRGDGRGMEMPTGIPGREGGRRGLGAAQSKSASSAPTCRSPKEKSL